MTQHQEATAIDPTDGFDHDAARREGWTLATCGQHPDDTAHVEIQKLDAPPDGSSTFAGDADAWAHVVERARAGSTLHRDALARADKIERALIEIAHGPW